MRPTVKQSSKYARIQEDTVSQYCGEQTRSKMHETSSGHDIEQQVRARSRLKLELWRKIFQTEVGWFIQVSSSNPIIRDPGREKLSLSDKRMSSYTANEPFRAPDLSASQDLKISALESLLGHAFKLV